MAFRRAHRLDENLTNAAELVYPAVEMGISKRLGDGAGAHRDHAFESRFLQR